jgi:GT2 family glycosyltransferase
MPDYELEDVPVSVVMGMRNSATTVLQTLESLVQQDYPMAEIIIVDNASSDDSVARVEAIRNQMPMRVRILRNRANVGLAGSFNKGVEAAENPLVVLMHSDGVLPSKRELRRLVNPLAGDLSVVASTPLVLMPEAVWAKYNFWQRCLFARSVGTVTKSSCGKFDCLRRDVFRKIGGFDTRHYSDRIGFGGEDSDLYIRIAREGRVVFSDAQVVHLHNLSPDYTMADWFRNRRLLARTYGRLLRRHFRAMTFPNAILMLTRPAIALLPLLPCLHGIGIALLVTFAILNSRRMYTTASSYRDWRILTLPLLDVALVYAESWWTLQGLLSNRTAPELPAGLAPTEC